MNPQYKPLELQKGANWSAIDEGPSYAVDAWMLACFIYEVYNGKLTKAEDLKKVGNIPEVTKKCLKFILKCRNYWDLINKC